MNPVRLQYFISEKNGTAVISLIGEINSKTVHILEECLHDIHRIHAENIVLNMHDIYEIDDRVVKVFAQLQACIRENPAALRVCFLRPDIKDMLLAFNAIKPAELKNNLIECLKSFHPHKTEENAIESEPDVSSFRKAS